MTGEQGAISDSHSHDLDLLQVKRVRLLASLTLLGGIGLLLAVPFALRAGAEFFLPVTAALVIAIALVPMLEWFERRGVPPKLAAALCVMIFLLLAIFGAVACSGGGQSTGAAAGSACKQSIDCMLAR